MYYKDNLKIYPQIDLEICTPDVEMIWVKLDLIRTRPIYYGLIYRPPSGKVETFLEELDLVITEIRSRVHVKLILLVT